MNRTDIGLKLIELGFSAASTGFSVIIDALEMIHEEGCIVKMKDVYKRINEQRKESGQSAQSTIYYTVKYYSKKCQNPHELLIEKGYGDLPVREFLFRLHALVYGEWA